MLPACTIIVTLTLFGWPGRGRSALTLTLNQRVGFESPAANQNLFNGWVETTLGRTGSLTLPKIIKKFICK
jgi:hypothetical protein